MPKLVDHDERRRSITAAAWRLIAARGIDAANMRDIATEAGYTNGALSHYFAGKDEILRTSYEHISEATDRRITEALGDATGLDALRILCREVMPINEEKLLEARIAASLWPRAMYDEQMAATNRRTMDRWREQMAIFLEQAREEGTVGDIDVTIVVEQLLNMMTGMQILGVLTPGETSSERQLEMLEQFVAAL